jgi:hypothetical protein
MKLSIMFISIIFCSFLCCTSSDRYDGKFVQDEEGKIYVLVHSCGDVYFVREYKEKKKPNFKILDEKNKLKERE